MNTQLQEGMTALVEASIRQHCKQLRTPTIRDQFAGLAQEAARQNQSYLCYLDALLQAELEERERNLIQRRLKEARIPRLKTFEEFDFKMASHSFSPQQIRELATGDYITRCESVIFLGEAGTGKSHLATALIVAACQQKRRARFETAAGIINELSEAQSKNQLGRALARWLRYELIAIDEMGYIPTTEEGAELLYQVISDRAERGAMILTTNLPFSEWTNVFKNPRLCKAVLDRVTDRAMIIETGTESYRFLRTVNQQKAVAA
jgi:DNA replication protein DnaC